MFSWDVCFSVCVCVCVCVFVIACSVMIWYCFMCLFCSVCVVVVSNNRPAGIEMWGEKKREKTQPRGSISARQGMETQNTQQPNTHTHTLCCSGLLQTHLCWTGWATRKKTNQDLWLLSYWKSEGHTHTLTFSPPLKIFLKPWTLKKMLP